MKLSYDFSEITEFLQDLKDPHRLESAFLTATQNIARVLHQHLLVNTPIDTGNLRKMWSAGDNLLFTVDKVPGGYEVTLINDARANSADGFAYGLAVNDGHYTPNRTGWVVGRFFVEKSVLQTESQVDRIIMNELRKWWDGV